MTVINPNQGAVKASEVATDTAQVALTTAVQEDVNTVLNQLRKLAAIALRKSSMLFRSTGDIRWDFDSTQPSATQYKVLFTSDIQVGFLTTESSNPTIDLKILTLPSGVSNSPTTFASVPLLDGQALVIELSQSTSEVSGNVGNAASASTATLPRLVIYPESALPSLMIAQANTGFSGAISIPLCIRQDTRLAWLINGDNWPSNFQSSLGFWSTSAAATTQTITTTATLTNDNKVIFIDGSSGSYTVNLPTAVGNTGKEFVLVRTDTSLTSTTTIQPFNTEQINGQSNLLIRGYNRTVTIISNGTGWRIEGAYAEYDSVRTVTGSLSLSIFNDMVFLNSASNISVTLPNPVGIAGKKIKLKKINGSTTSLMTILPFASETIDGDPAYRMAIPFHVVELMSDGTNWNVIFEHAPVVKMISATTGNSIPIAVAPAVSIISASAGITFTSTGRKFKVYAEWVPGGYLQVDAAAGSMVYEWYIDGTPSGSGGTLLADTGSIHTAPNAEAILTATPGSHTVTLVANQGASGAAGSNGAFRIVVQELY